VSTKSGQGHAVKVDDHVNDYDDDHD